MSGARIEISADVAEAQGVFAQLIELGDDLTPVMEDIGAAMTASTKLRFETGTGPAGVPWKPSRRAQEEGGKTLVDRALLRDSIHFEASANQVLIGTNDRRAAAHQFGAIIVPRKGKALRFKVGDRWATVKRVVLPARPFIGDDADDRQEIVEIGLDHLRRASRPGGAA